MPENALALMRPRYSAYALGIAKYLIDTTHPDSSLFIKDQKKWLLQIQAFSKQVSFDGLEILDTQVSDRESFVLFVAHLSKEGEDLTFTERSRFVKVGQSWKYFDGKIASGRVTQL